MSPMMTWLTLLSMATGALLYVLSLDALFDKYKADK